MSENQQPKPQPKQPKPEPKMDRAPQPQAEPVVVLTPPKLNPNQLIRIRSARNRAEVDRIIANASK